MEAPAYINENINCYAVSANFGGYEMTSEKGYSLVIPEGTVIADYGDPIVNHRCSIPVIASSGINSLSDEKSFSPIYDLNGSKVKVPEHGKMYVKNGKTFICN